MNQRNSIKRMDMGGGRTMMAFRIPPPHLPALEKTALGEAILGRDIVSDHERLTALIEALETASTADLDLARPMLYFQLEELRDLINGSGSQVSDTLEFDVGSAGMLRGILNGVTSDIEKTISAIDRNPRAKRSQEVLRGCMSYLAEILAFANAAAANYGNDEFRSIMDDASEAYVKFAREIRKMASELEVRYQGISERFGDPDALLREASAHVNEVDMTIPAFTGQSVERLIVSVGERGYLHGPHDSEERMEKAIEAGRYRRLTDYDADELRTELVGLFKDVNRSFNTGGLVSELLMATAALRFRASSSINYADKHTEGEIRQDRKSPYDSKKEHEARIEKRIAEIPAERFRMRATGAYWMARGNLIAGLLNDVHGSLHPGMKVHTISFERFAEGILVGTVPDFQDAIVISRDKSVGSRDAVWLARVPRHEIVGGFDNARAKEFDGTNFYSVDQALQDLRDERVQELFFDGIKIEGHNGFEILDAERKAIHKQLANGTDISSFPEYDGTSAFSMSR